MAATGAALACGIPVRQISKVLSEFKGLEHRLEYVTTVDRVDYYNDSKATNPDSTEKALTAFDRPIILLLGGKNKGSSFKGLNKKINRSTVKQVIIYGQASSQLDEEISGVNKTRIEKKDFDHVIKEASKIAEPGDIVLLSPACASFDMFTNFEERGTIFKEEVLQMAKNYEISKKKA